MNDTERHGVEGQGPAQTIGRHPKGIMVRNVERLESGNRNPSLEKCRIGILGLCRGAGVSFLALALAKAVSDQGLVPAVVEFENGGIYDALGMEARFAGREFFSYHRALHEERRIRGRDNLDEGINWALRCPGDEDVRLGELKMMRLIENVRGEVILCDFSGLDLASRSNTLTAELLKDMDGLIAVVDPLPSKLLGNFAQLLEISRLSKEVVCVVNKNNRGVNRQELLRMLNMAGIVELPFVPPEEIYEAEYNCRIAYGSPQVRKQLQGPVREIMKRIIPPELIRF